jgi:hypothetical protein
MLFEGIELQVRVQDDIRQEEVSEVRKADEA